MCSEYKQGVSYLVIRHRPLSESSQLHREGELKTSAWAPSPPQKKKKNSRNLPICLILAICCPRLQGTWSFGEDKTLVILGLPTIIW